MSQSHTMSEATLAALRGSIAKWEGVLAGTISEDGCDNCPLCQLFSHYTNPDVMPGCRGCPVQERTGKPGCIDTPYFAYADYEFHVAEGEADEDETRRRELALAELDFLKSLLPTDVVPDEKNLTSGDQT